MISDTASFQWNVAWLVFAGVEVDYKRAGGCDDVLSRKDSWAKLSVERVGIHLVIEWLKEH
jgi:hypothetical protein